MNLGTGKGEKKSSLYIKKLLYLFLYSNTFDAYLHGMEICKNFPKKKIPLYNILAFIVLY